MKKTLLIFSILIGAILSVGWNPLSQSFEKVMSPGVASSFYAASGEPELVITNLTGQVFFVTLTGPESYTVQVATGKNMFVVAQGEYTLSYFACGAQQTKTVNVKKSGGSIKLTCETPKKGKTPQLTIDNKTAPVYVTFTGPKLYSFYALTGKTDFAVDPGTYEVSYYACGAQTTISFTVKKKGGTLKISCLDITFINLNDTEGVGLSLEGPADYYFYLAPGAETAVRIIPGTYDYELSGPCSASDSITFKKKAKYFVFCFSD